MKNLVVGLLILVVSVFLVLVIANQQTQESQTAVQPVTTETKINPEATTFPEPAAGSIVFDMKYLGLSGGKDELRYNSYWGFGSSEIETPFIKELKKDNKELTTVYNNHFKGAEWSAVEIKDNKPVAFYFDLNADGKLSDNEKILPIKSEESSGRTSTEFVTPDFTVNTNDGKQVPFRALLQVNFYQGSSRPSCMWSPSCVMEGTSTINNERTKLILFTNGFKGSFNEFGSCSYYLQNSDKKIGQNVSRQSLSSIINYNGQFYNLTLLGTHEKDKTIRAALEKYTGTTGELVVKLSGNADLPAKLSSASIISSKGKPIYFNIDADEYKLPTASYKLSNGYINYGPKSNEWRLNFSQGPEFTINTDQTSTVELGKPTLSVSAIDESKRYQSDVKEQTVYSRGITILLSRKVTGMAGELYGYFWQQSSNSSVSIKPDIKITGPDGIEIASAQMEYG